MVVALLLPACLPRVAQAVRVVEVVEVGWAMEMAVLVLEQM